MNTPRYIIIIIIIIIFWAGFLYGQKISTIECISQFDSLTNRTIYLFEDSIPKFPGGIDSLTKFIEKNLKYPNDGGDFTGTVLISFIVESNGNLTNVTAYQGIYEPADKEALRVIELMPKWIAGKCKGKPVPVKIILPIRFKLDKE